MNFFRLVFAAFFGTILATVIGFFLLILIVGGIISSATAEEVVQVPSNSILRLDLNSAITERAVDDPFQKLFAGPFGGGPSHSMGLNQLTEALKAAKTDDKIKGVYLSGGIIPAAPATIETMRNAILDFRQSGKFIYAYSEIYSEGGYYVATAADSIYIYPQGGMEWNGMASTPMFFKGAMDKLGLKAQVFKVGTFKSATEPFTETKMSEANREQYTVLLGDIWNHMLAGIGERRKIDPKTLGELATNLTVSEAEDAYTAKLIDGIRYEDEVLAMLAAKQGEEKEPNFIDLDDYHKSIKSSQKYNDSRIAVVYAVGDIVMGSGEGVVGSEDMVKAIRTARNDKRVKAIVLRVNSPGGSALASDMIWREIELAKAEKPVIASYGDYAASGGYYISANADYIVSEPTTLTGSIGVFGLLINTQGLFEDKMGITFDRVTTNPYADMGNPNRPMNAFEAKFIQSGVEGTYKDFAKVVADGRPAPLDDYASVDKIGQGRVWTGVRALELKLVDEIGGLDAAIAQAATRAGVADGYSIVEYPRVKTTVEQISDAFNTRLRAEFSKLWLTPEQQHLVKTLKQTTDPRGIYMQLMPLPVIE